MKPTFVIDTLEQFKALAHPLRQRIFEQLALKARTTKQVAEELGEKPTRLYHHVAALDRAGLIRLVLTKPNRGATEKYYEAVARSIQVDPSLFADGAGDPAVQQSGAGLVQGLIANLGRDVAALMNDPETDPGLNEEAILAQVEIYGDEATLQAARARLEEFLEWLQSESSEEEPGSANREARRLVLAWYPPPGSK